ncbi:JNK1/MAPK8-associated membrane protein [Acanthosepion pharaonis]|uniref:JNK1/MAPK8-associated membrane protein n=1 Tax=Acanthosepion pharaonis TaxID=158019 RepID=A0A812BN61_ACAPH|nr:JNK1/MAPK8-associated membrane protein [Sepia pharaonis]
MLTLHRRLTHFLNELISLKMPLCPGLYCGKTNINGKLSDCGACPRGFQPNDHSICEMCDEVPPFYDCLYLGFMALLPLLLHWFFVEYKNRRSKFSKSLILLHISAFVECVLAGVLTLLMFDPRGKLTIRSCPVKRLSDWYTLWYNPSTNYVDTVHCTQEIVYPLYTMVIIYYAFALVLMVLIRPLLSYKCVSRKGTTSIYAALYFFPMLICLQAVFGGLLYYAYPYILIVLSLATHATHLAYCRNQTIRGLFQENFTKIKNLVIIVGHWLLHAYGIIAITQLTKPEFHASLLVLTVFPTIFYIVTCKFSDPYLIDRAFTS